MQLLYIMRHGQSIVNTERRLTCKKYDGDLSKLGREQAARAAAWLLDRNITQIIHSPFHRAEQTARIIAPALKLEPRMDNGLSEMDCGDLEGRTDDEGWAIWQQVYNRWLQGEPRAVFPGGETYQQAYERFSAALGRIQEGDSVLFVTHGGISCAVIPYLCVNAAALQGPRELDNTGLVILEPYGDGRYICRAWNLNEHLALG